MTERAGPGVMSDMTDGEGQDGKPKPAERPPPMHPELRVGDSARARFYRLKDELLNFPHDCVSKLARDAPATFEVLAKDYYVPLRREKNALDENEDDEEALARARAIMEAISKKADELGFTRY